jgi:hypothetical protein
MKSIYIHNDTLDKLYAMSTWKKFKNMSYADIIRWILANDVIADEIIKSLKGG